MESSEERAIKVRIGDEDSHAIPLAAGVLCRFGIVLSPAIGAVFMSLSTVVVAINTRLLRRVGKRLGGEAI
jgi:hypothetical protein